MINIDKKSDCSGCHSCLNVCPKKCISMERDNEGFLYPIIDKAICIDCGLCEKVCQCINPIESQNFPEAYACYNTDIDVRRESSSGGIFTLLANEIINRGGVVFGAAFDNDLLVHHTCVEKKEDLYKLRGSKYLQSTIGLIYSDVKEVLNSGRCVLFTGTPCQIDGLLHYLNKDYKNLYTQDIICHGAPSPMSWKAYLKYQESVFGKEIDREALPMFRVKNKGWKQFSMKLCFSGDAEYSNTFDKDIYMKAFLSNLSLRPSCYRCNSKSLNRNSDITLADFWGIENVMPEMFDDRGTSLVFVNTEKGKELLDGIKDFIVYKKVPVEDAIKYNVSAYKSVTIPGKRKYFMSKLNKMDFDKLVYKSLRVSFMKRIINKTKSYLMKIDKRA